MMDGATVNAGTDAEGRITDMIAFLRPHLATITDEALWDHYEGSVEVDDAATAAFLNAEIERRGLASSGS